MFLPRMLNIENDFIVKTEFYFFALIMLISLVFYLVCIVGVLSFSTLLMLIIIPLPIRKQLSKVPGL